MAADLFIVKGIRRFNKAKVLENTRKMFGKTHRNRLVGAMEQASYEDKVTTLLFSWGLSTQGIEVAERFDGAIEVVVPWMAAEADVDLCYCYLTAIKKVHRSARVSIDDNEVKFTPEYVQELWAKHEKAISEALSKGEELTLNGIVREFHLHPSFYNGIEDESKVETIMTQFAELQWDCNDLQEPILEQRHLCDDEDVSTLRVLDNTEDVFVGECRFVGLMRGNDCKIVPVQDFILLMQTHEEFVRRDYCQFTLDGMLTDAWEKAYNEANGKEIKNFRKTFILRWNTDISNHKIADFEDGMAHFHDDEYYYNWSMWDYRHAHVGDKFYLIRTGDGRHGVVMSGVLTSNPYVADDWSKRSRKVYYVDMNMDFMIHPEKAPILLTTEELEKAIPDFNWEEGHSGEMLNDEQSEKMESVWQEYISKIHEAYMNDDAAKDYSDKIICRDRDMFEPYQGQGGHIETIMKPEKFIAEYISQTGLWDFAGAARTHVTANGYKNEEADIIAVRKESGDMSMLALLLNDVRAGHLSLVASYPEHKGLNHEVEISKVYEWKSQLEAVVYGHVGELDFAFFATDYWKNKNRYAIGAKLDIDLSAAAYHLMVGEQEIVVDGDKANEYRKDFGDKPEFDENGQPVPLTFSCEQLVGFFDNGPKYPDEADFVSPVNGSEPITLFDIGFIKTNIIITHEPEDVVIPLYYRKEMLPTIADGTSIRGLIWIMGKISE